MPACSSRHQFAGQLEPPPEPVPKPLPLTPLSLEGFSLGDHACMDVRSQQVIGQAIAGLSRGSVDRSSTTNTPDPAILGFRTNINF